MSNIKMHPLRLARTKRNLSRKALADFLLMNEKTIQRAESGETINPDSRQRICEFFGKTSEELGLVATESASELQIAELLQNEVEEMKRRQLLKLFGAAGTLAVGSPQVFLEPAPWESLSNILRKPSQIDASNLEILDTITKNYWQLRRSDVPPEIVLHSVVEHLKSVTQIVQRSFQPKLREQVCSVAGKISLLAGELSFESNDPIAARGYFKAAIDAGEEGNNFDLKAMALGRLGLMCLYSEPLKTQGFLQCAKQMEPHIKSRMVGAWLSCVEAEAYSMTQNELECLSAFDHAASYFSDEESQDDPYWTGLDRSLASGYKGACFIHLQQPGSAAATLQDSLASLNPTHKPRRAIVLTDLASALIATGEIEAACTITTEAYALNGQLRSGVVSERLTKLHTQLIPWKTIPAIKSLSEQLLLA